MAIKNTNSMNVLSLFLSIFLASACSVKPEAMLNSAKDYLAKNDNKAAVIQIKNALQIDPNLPEARYLLGASLLDSGDAVGAETELRKALDLKHSQDVVIPPLAKALLAQGKSRKLIEDWSGVELNQPSAKANLQMSLTYAYAQQGKDELSKNALKAALQADPTYEPALIAQARQKAEQRDFDGALLMLDEIIAKYSKSYEAWKLKGDIYLYVKNLPSDALASYQKSIEIKPDFSAGQAAVITLLMQQGNLTEAEKQIGQLKKYSPNSPQSLFLEAQMAYQRKDFKLARDRVDEVLKGAPNNIQGLQLAGAVALQLNSLIQAEDYLSRAVQAAPNLLLARRALVLTYLRLGQPGKSMTALLPGLSQETIDPDLLSLAGEVYLQNGDFNKAQEYFSKASRQDPKNGRKRTTLALAHWISGSPESALVELQDIAGSDVGTTADLALISAYMKRQEFEKAVKAIDVLERKQPTNPLASLLRGRILLETRDVVGARKNFERALKTDPTYFPAVASLAGLDVDDKRPEEAKKRFQVFLGTSPNNSQALLALAELSAKTGASKEEVARRIGEAISANPTDVNLHLLLIDFYLKNQDVKAAASAAQNAVATLPASPQALDALGRTQQASGELNQTLTTYNKLAVMQPFATLPYLRLASVHMAEKNKDAARTSLKKVLEIKPDTLEAQRALIVLELEEKNVQEALKIARSVQSQKPLEAVGFSLEGDVHASQKNWDSAAVAYRAGLKKINSAKLSIKLHSVLVASGNGMEADKFSTIWQKDNPKDAVFPFYLGDAALARNDYDLAEKNFSAVVKLQSNNAVAYNNLAWLSAKLKKDGAMAYAEKANTLAPNQPAFMDTLAVLLSDKGDYAKAVELQTKALALAPQNASLKLNMVKIYIKAGKKDLAKKELDDLIKLGDKFSGQSEVESLRKVL